MSIVYRKDKNEPLTFQEMDSNFSYLYGLNIDFLKKINNSDSEIEKIKSFITNIIPKINLFGILANLDGYSFTYSGKDFNFKGNDLYLNQNKVAHFDISEISVIFDVQVGDIPAGFEVKIHFGNKELYFDQSLMTKKVV